MEKKLLYVHGMSSSGASSTPKKIQEMLPDVCVIAPDIPINPDEALVMLKSICKEERPDLVMGTSMGGMYAQQMHGYNKILINPAFHVSGFMRQNLGTQSFMNPRKDGVMKYAITAELCDAYQQVEQKQFEGITDYDKTHTMAFYSIHDTLVNCKAEYLLYYNRYELFDGEHRLNAKVLTRVLIPYIKQTM